MNMRVPICFLCNYLLCCFSIDNICKKYYQYKYKGVVVWNDIYTLVMSNNFSSIIIS